MRKKTMNFIGMMKSYSTDRRYVKSYTHDQVHKFQNVNGEEMNGLEVTDLNARQDVV
jgi:hypothetical protein